MLRKMKKILNILIIILTPISLSELNAQPNWSIVWKKLVIKDTLYTIYNENLGIDSSSTFPPFAGSDSQIIGGISFNENSTKNEFTNGHNFLAWHKKFSKPIKNIENSTCILDYIYCKSVSSYRISIRLKQNQKWYSRNFAIFNEGFQRPNSNLLDSYITNKKDLHEPDNLEFDELKLEIEKRVGNDTYQFIIGELLILNYAKENIKIQHPFFNDLVDLNNGMNQYHGKVLTDDEWILPHKGIPSLFGSSDLFYNEESFGSNLELIPRDSNVTNEDEKNFLHDFTRLCLDYYPFYEERVLNKKELINEFEKIRENNKNKPFDESVVSISRFLEKFHDGHFSVNLNSGKPKARRLNSPVRLIEIDNVVRVAAVFDTNLSPKIPLNSVVTEIDTIPINIYLNQLINEDGIGMKEAVRICLNRDLNSSSLLTFITPLNEVKSEQIKYDVKYYISSNFNPKHCEFKIIGAENDIAYFRLNNWGVGDYLFLVNNIDKINNSGGLIIDIRGNGGGESLEAMRILSLFIDKPAVFSHDKNYFGDWETQVVIPDKEGHILVPTIVLIDEKTACASEEFVEAMRLNTSLLIVGKASTTGAFAALNTLLFPSGLEFRLNILYPKLYSAKQVSIEGKGIIPDVWIKINSVFDLYPYNDKVLKAAMALLKN